MNKGLKKRPLVTFILVTYNQEEYIREAIEGAFKQTYEPLEIILSDDFSTDNTYRIMQELVESYNGNHVVKLIQNPQNKGLIGHLNSVISEANGSIISWGAGDDIALPHRTEILVREILTNPKILAAHSAIIEVNTDGSLRGVREHSYNIKNISLSAVLNEGCSVVTQSMAFRKNLFDIFGPFRTDLTHEGKAMAFRLITSGDVIYVDKPLTKYRVGCGVSTYAGVDIEKNKNSEPIKINIWYLSAYRQMLSDSKKLPRPLSKKNKDIIKNRIQFFENLQKINDASAFIIPNLHNLILRPKNSMSIRATLRKITPKSFYRVLSHYIRKSSSVK